MVVVAMVNILFSLVGVLPRLGKKRATIRPVDSAADQPCTEFLNEALQKG